MFNQEEPDFTQEELYTKYIKTIETVEIQAQNEYDKALNNIDLIEGNLTVGITSLYAGILDLESAIDVQNESLELRQRIQSELEAMYNEGLISEFDLYTNQVEVDKLEIEIKKLDYQKEGLYYSLKNMTGLHVEDELNILSSLGGSYYKKGTAIATYKELAITNSPTLEAMRIDLGYFAKTLELYQANEGYDFGSEYEELTYQIEKFGSELQESEWKLENNVEFAIGDLIAIEENITSNTIALKNAMEQLKQGQLQLELGLAKQTDLHQLELAVQGSKLSYSQSLRAYKSALVKLDMLVEFGVEYN